MYINRPNRLSSTSLVQYTNTHLHDDLDIGCALTLHNPLHSTSWPRSVGNPAVELTFLAHGHSCLTELGRTTYFLGVVVLTCNIRGLSAMLQRP